MAFLSTRVRFTSAQVDRIRAIYDTFAEVDNHPFERRVVELQKELHPLRVLDQWERMSTAYRNYCEKHSPSAEAKKEIYKLILLRSLMPEQEIFEQAQLRILTQEQAREVLKEMARR